MLQILSFFKGVVKSTNFWQQNYIFLREFKYFWGAAILAILFSIFAAFFEGITIGVINAFLQGLTNPLKPPIKTGLEWFNIWVLAIQSPVSERVLRLGLLIILLGWLRSLFTYLGSFYSKLSEVSFGDRIRKSVFDQLISLNLSYFSKSKSGDLIHCITNEVINIQKSFWSACSLFIRGSTLFVYIVSMFVISWQMSIAAILLFGSAAIVISKFVLRVRELTFPVGQAYSDFSSTTLEFISGIRTILTSDTQEFERKRFYKSSEEIRDKHFRLMKAMDIVRPIGEAVSTTILISVIVITFNVLVSNGLLDSAALLTFMFILFRMIPLVDQVNSIRVELGSYSSSYERLKDILSPYDKSYFENGHIKLQNFQHSINFVDVEFSYNSDQIILQDINLSIEQGNTVAFVGASGAGKTTLVDLVPRLNDPTKGSIYIDGINLSHIEINSLRGKIAIVSQDTFIFNASVADNIAYGLDSVNDEDLYDVAKRANALDFILEMSEGFNTILGDRGVRLSGGQRQRIAIARALLRKPKILILDEATSALDSVTERLIQDSLENISKGCTVIAIAHRLSTIVRADKVVVLEKGRIVEQGTYHDLIEKKGSLWKYHQMQNESQ